MPTTKQRVHELGFQNNNEEIFVINDAEGADNFAYGVELKTSKINQGQLVTGQYNSSANIDNQMVVVGGGTSESSRRNLYTLDKQGNATFSGTVQVTKGNETTEVATQQDLKNVAIGKFHTLDQPISVAVNLNSTTAGQIQTGGQTVTVGIDSASQPLSTAFGGTGRSITPGQNTTAVLRGDMSLLEGNAGQVVGWNNTGELTAMDIEATNGGNSSNQKPYLVSLSLESNSSAEENQAEDITYIGVTGTLPLNKTNAQFDSSVRTNTDYFLSGQKMEETGEESYSWKDVSALRKVLGVYAIVESTSASAISQNNSHTFTLDQQYTKLLGVIVTVMHAGTSSTRPTQSFYMPYTLSQKGTTTYPITCQFSGLTQGTQTTTGFYAGALSIEFSNNQFTITVTNKATQAINFYYTITAFVQ